LNDDIDAQMTIKSPLDTTGQTEASPNEEKLVGLALAALGVVYGDIGTSPLYAIKECFHPEHGITPDLGNVLGILSIVFWALTLSVVIKYLTFVMRADNHGEGGIMSLLALTMHRISPSLGVIPRPKLILLALFGTALLFADGMITPAISVLSAVEGLEVATPMLRFYVVPITLLILVGLFLFQRKGTAGVAMVFGPAMLLWFFTLAALGLPWIVRHPVVLKAIFPWYAIQFFLQHRWHGFMVLAAAVLCITGTEALYADMGHFGRRPIRLAWYVLVFPALLINYFGQGGIILGQGAVAIKNPFFALAPAGTLYLVVGIATIATIIASQALISGSFSLTQQGMQLGYIPRLAIVHTSSEMRGQIYIPEINSLLMITCCLLVLQFKTSSNLAAAYGLSVMGTMTITTTLMFPVFRDHWGWSYTKALLLVGIFFAVDIPFLTANMTKIAHGGYVPLLIGGAIFSVLTTWKRGRTLLAQELNKSFLPIAEFMPSVKEEKLARVKGSAVFMTSNLNVVPPVLLHHVKHNKVLHEQVILLNVITSTIPEVKPGKRVEIKELGHGFFQVVAHYGYMQTPNVPEILKRCRKEGLKVLLEETSFYMGRETLLTSGRTSLSRWRKALFAYLSRNARPATAFFGIPPNRVVEMGMQVEI
jgi:KUP system potassium uptake protein